MKKKILKLAAFGFALGIVVNSVISALTAVDLPVTPALLETAGSLRAAMLLELVLSGLYGAVCMAGITLYDVERLPLAAATLLHCLLCVGLFIPLSLFLGWFSGLVEILIMTGCQIFGFFLIWLIIYNGYRKEIRQLNKMQKDYLDETNQNTQGGTL